MKNIEQKCVNTLNLIYKIKHHMYEIIRIRTKNWKLFTLTLRAAWGWKRESWGSIIRGDVH